ncbi:hypothetical protein Tco_0958315 [Tanacetum coccineum]
MANEEQDDQQQKVNKLDALLVPIDEQVKIRLGNFMIDLEKTKPDVIYKVCLDILQQYSFFNTFIRIADALEINMQQFTKLIIKHILSKNNHISKRLHSYHHVIKIDQVLKNLKFANKGAKDPVFGMPIPMVMLNDEIKASADYADYLANTKGGKLKGRGKGPVTMKGVEVVVEKIAYVRVPKTKRTYTLTEQSGQSEGVEDDADFEETEEEDEIPLVQRQTRVVIGRQVHQESDEEALDHSKKLKGVERMSETTEFLLQLKKAKKARSGVTLAVSDEPEDSSSTSSSDSNDEIEDISSDDDDKAVKENVDDGNQFINDNPEVSLTDVLKEPKAEVQSLSGCSSSSTESS